MRTERAMASAAPAIPRIQDGDHHRPQQRAGEHRDPARPGGDRVADDTVGPEHDEFVQEQQQQHRQRLLRQREDAHAQLELVRQEAHQQEGEGVLTERRALQEVDGKAAQPREHQPSDARRAERPVDHQKQQQVRARDIHPARQRQHGEDQGEHYRRGDAQSADASVRDAHFLVASIASSGAGTFGVSAHSSSTSRSRSSCASGFASTVAKVSAELRSTFVTVATGYPAGKIASRPELTSRSPLRTSDSTVRYGRLSLAASPVPMAIERIPLRFTCIGTACSASVIRIKVAVVLPTCITCPTTPKASSTGCPRNTPSSAPLLMTTMCRNGLTETLMISAISVRSLTPFEASRISRNRRFSSLSDSNRSSWVRAMRSCSVSCAFSVRSCERSAKLPVIQRHSWPGVWTTV